MAEKQQYTQLHFGFDIRTGSPVDRRLILSYDEMMKGEVEWGGVKIPLRNIIPDKYVVLCTGSTTPIYEIYARRYKGKLFVYDAELSHDQDDYHIPMGDPSGDPTGKGLFTMVSKTIDVVDQDGSSLTDADGVVTVYDPDGSRIETAEQRLDVAEADIEELKVSKVDSEGVGRVVDDKLQEYQRRTYIYGNGDELDSEGMPHPKSGAAGYGVHVTVEKSNTEPWKALISHEAVVPDGGWISKYAVGGVAVGQAFAAGTKIEDVLRQLFEGDPMADNVVYCAVNSVLPYYWTDIPWIPFTTTRDKLLPGGEDHPFNRWTPVTANHEFIMISVPLAMCHNYGTDPSVELPVRLDEVYVRDEGATQFPLPYMWYDVKNNTTSSEKGYRIFYLTREVTDTYHELEWTFRYNDPDYKYDDPDHKDPDR